MMRTDRNEHETNMTTSPSVAPENAKNQDIIKVIGFGGTAVLVGVNFTANTLVFISMDKQGGPLATSFQSLVFGIFGGSLMSVGKALAEPIGKKDFVTASEIAKTAYVMTGVMTLASTLSYCALYFALPQLYSADAAKSASIYLLSSGVGLFPTLALLTGNQIAFQCGDWKAPLIATAMFRIPAAGFGYLLGEILNLNEIGLGLGNSIAPLISYVGMELWLRREEFQKIKQVSFSIEIIKKHFMPLLRLAAKMSTRGITEWGNLMAINTVLSRMNSENLTVLAPSLQITSFFILLSQGIALGCNMVLSVQRSKMKNQMAVMNLQNIDVIKTAQKEVQLTAIKGLAVGLVINAVFAITLFLARKPLVNLFIANNTSENAYSAAQTVFIINSFALMIDTIRIISGILLTSWDKIVQPNIASLITMSVIGIPVSYAISEKEKSNVNDVVVMFSVRLAMIFLAALINIFMLYQSIVVDKKEINDLVQRDEHDESSNEVKQESCFRKWCNMFEKTRDENANSVPLLNISQIRNLNDFTV